jgi:hypothetical protein
VKAREVAEERASRTMGDVEAVPNLQIAFVDAWLDPLAAPRVVLQEPNHLVAI